MVLHLHKQCPFMLRLFLRNYTKTASKPSIYTVPEVPDGHRDSRVSEIIDVRTPAEFEEDHIPGAVNLPVLSNDERVTVGKLYSSNKFEARKTGAAIILRNIASHIDEYFQSCSTEYSPLVYCWRGGQRSYSMAMVLTQIGFQTFVLDKGYKQYRATVRQDLLTLPYNLHYRIISGLTGSGKTKILQALEAQGHQVLDLEHMAKHKGSVLGLWHGETQPSQKYFDSLLCDKLHTFSISEPVWVESESIRIGKICVPLTFFQKLQTAPRYCVHLPLEERVNHIIKDYPNWVEHRNDLKLIIEKLVKVRGHAKVNEWLSMIDDGRGQEFVRSILLEHYDPAYELSQNKNNRSVEDAQDVHVPDMEDETLTELVHQLSTS